MIRQHAAGIYSWLPLGYSVLNKIVDVVCEEQDRAGAQRMLMPTIQSADLWYESGRYDSYGKEMLRISDRYERPMLYGPTNEEMMTAIFRSCASSYRDMPLNLYHVQWKFRDEIRPRFGVMRGREFLMKDAYSFDLDYQTACLSYDKMILAYLRTFQRLGVKAIPVQADSGPIGGSLSHEFVILTPNGDTAVFYDKKIMELPIPDPECDSDITELAAPWKSLYAATQDKHDPETFSKLPEESQISAQGIEVGHTFYFGTKYSEAMNAKVATPDGIKEAVHMGSYGIGISRLVGAIIEASHDERGIIWPDEIAPFNAIIINLNPGDATTDSICLDMYHQIKGNGLSVLYDDTEAHAGAKLATADLVGVPWQVILGTRDATAGVATLKRRATGEKSALSLHSIVSTLSPHVSKENQKNR